MEYGTIAVTVAGAVEPERAESRLAGTGRASRILENESPVAGRGASPCDAVAVSEGEWGGEPCFHESKLAWNAEAPSGTNPPGSLPVPLSSSGL